jgi:heterodisulfide reductase subunit A
MAAAQTLDACGITVQLVEQAESLGGKAFQWACMATDSCQSCGACLAAEMVARTAALERTSVHLQQRLVSVETVNGRFEAHLEQEGSGPIRADAILLATGLTPFDPSPIEDLAYASSEKVMTTVDLNAVLKNEGLSDILPDGRPPAIAFVQCVGSRNRELGCDYCSQVCCKTAIRQADRILHDLPDANISIFHIDLQVIGKVFRTQAANLAPRVQLHQGVPAKILTDLEPDRLSIIRENAESGDREAIHFDLIVLATGLRPSEGSAALFGQLGVKPDQWGFLGGHQAQLPDRFYAAGCSLGPNDILTSRDQGITAALQIAADLGSLPAPDTTESLSVLVWGGCEDGELTARHLAESGYAVHYLEPREQIGFDHPGISAYPQSRLTALEGVVGDYQVAFTSAGQKLRVPAAAVVVAAGIQLADAAVATDNRFVQSLSEFAERFDNEPADRPDTVVFWLDRVEPEWKAHARECLHLSLAQAESGGRAVVIMQKMLVHGLTGQQLYDKARRKGVRFLRMHDPSRLKLDSGGDRLKLTFREETLPGIELSLDCDLLVVPEPVKNPPLAAEIAGVIRQPRDVEGFLQSANIRHRPIGSPRRGIFFIGTCHSECDRDDVLREIEALESALATLAVKDFDLDPPPVINENQCVRCLTCFRVCPHGAVTLRNHYQPEIAPKACFGCGLCVTNCPALAIDPARPLDPDASKAPAAGETIVFACERSAELALDAARAAGFDPGDKVRIVPVRCAGSLDEITLLQLAAGGAERVIVAGCHEGNCRSMEGSGFAAARANKIAADMGAADGRIRHVTVAANEPRSISRILTATGSKKEES